MDFYEVIRTRRGVRDFRPDPIPDDVLERVLGALTDREFEFAAAKVVLHFRSRVLALALPGLGD